MKILFVLMCFAFVCFQAVRAGFLTPSSPLTMMSISMPDAPKQNYTRAQWADLVKNLMPHADNANAAPIIQHVNAGKVAKKNSLITGQIIGGVNAALGQFPWQAIIVMDDAHVCGGSLILANWILTAAHCALNVTSFEISLGVVDRFDSSDPRLDIVTTEKYIHAFYSNVSKVNDIALLKLPIIVTMSAYIQMVKLPPLSDATKTFEGVVATASGFGRTFQNNKGGSQFLQTAQLPVISNSKCSRKFTVFSSTICTWVVDKSICKGDSGGALVYQDSTNAWVQIGIASFVAASGCLNAPSAYARVSSFLGWISDTIAQSEFKTDYATPLNMIVSAGEYGEVTNTPTSTTVASTSKETVTTVAASGSSTSTASTSASSTGATATERATVKTSVVATATTKKSKATKPPKCFTADFSQLHTCCDTPMADVFSVNKNDKACKYPNSQVFNNFILNKQQKASNSIDFSDLNVQKALSKDACFANCFLESKNLTSNGQINVMALKQSVPASNQNSAWAARINKGLSDCLEMSSNKLIGNFPNGKSSCPGIGLVVMQCTVKKSIENCPVESRSASQKCQKAWAAFDYCKNLIF